MKRKRKASSKPAPKKRVGRGTLRGKGLRGKRSRRGHEGRKLRRPPLKRPRRSLRKTQRSKRPKALRKKLRRRPLFGLPSPREWNTSFRSFLRTPSDAKRRTFALIHFPTFVSGGVTHERVIPFALGYLTKKQLQKAYPDAEALLDAYYDATGNSIEDATLLGYGALLTPAQRRGMKIWRKGERAPKSNRPNRASRVRKNDNPHKKGRKIQRRNRRV